MKFYKSLQTTHTDSAVRKAALLTAAMMLLSFCCQFFYAAYPFIAREPEELRLSDTSVFLIEGETYRPDVSPYVSLTYESSDPEVVTVSDDGTFTAGRSGTALVTVSSASPAASVWAGHAESEISVTVTDLLVPYELNNDKPLLTNGPDTHRYSSEDNDVLDAFLEWQINRSGYHTRAGAVQAARFLTLEMPYKVPYFYENGRIENHGYYRSYCDGEGRFYHKGLYLSSDRTDLILAEEYGPAAWGNYIYSYPAGDDMRNGLDCSGFISWVLLNAGYDVGDVGSGWSEFDDDLSDICELDDLTYGSLAKALPGDLLFYNGHVGMIIGIREPDGSPGSPHEAKDRTIYYIAEAYDPDLHVLEYDADQLMYSRYTHIGFMEKVYGEDGALTMMW